MGPATGTHTHHTLCTNKNKSAGMRADKQAIMEIPLSSPSKSKCRIQWVETMLFDHRDYK